MNHGINPLLAVAVFDHGSAGIGVDGSAALTDEGGTGSA